MARYKIYDNKSDVITPEAARARIQTAIDQYRESQKKSAPDTKK